MSNAKIIKNALHTVLVSLSLTLNSFANSSPKHIAITQFVEHVAADAVRKGLLEELAKQGYREGETFKVTFENAQGNASTASQIARKFLGLNPDVIVAITTPSAQAMVKIVGNNTIPIVFSAVTDPVSAGLVADLQYPASDVTGVRDAPPIKEQMAFIKTLLPQAKTIGILYNPGDSGSVSSLNIIREQAKMQEFELVEVTPIKSSDIQTALLQFVGRVDAIYVPLDNMIVSAMSSVAAFSLKHNLPLFSVDSGSVEAGALACLGYSYDQTGRKTGEIVSDILKGMNPAEISVASPGTTDIFINRHALEKLKLTLPEAVRKQAHYY